MCEIYELYIRNIRNVRNIRTVYTKCMRSMHLRMVTDNLSELILENLKLEPRRLVRWIESRGYVIYGHIYLSELLNIIIKSIYRKVLPFAGAFLYKK